MAHQRMPAALYRLAISGYDRRAPSVMSNPSPTASLKAFTAPKNKLPEMFSKCPRYVSHLPAAEMWSVVHLPLAFIKIGNFT